MLAFGASNSPSGVTHRHGIGMRISSGPAFFFCDFGSVYHGVPRGRKAKSEGSLPRKICCFELLLGTSRLTQMLSAPARVNRSWTCWMSAVSYHC